MSPILSTITLLHLHFALDYFETFSLLRAFAGIPYSPHYFSIIALFYLNKNSIPTRGIILGKQMLIDMQALMNARDGKIPGLRFSKYREVIIRNENA